MSEFILYRAANEQQYTTSPGLVMKIACSDDEAAMLRLREITFESNGIRVIMAMHAKEGSIPAGNPPPDMILPDPGLPDKSGQVVLKSRLSWHQDPIILLAVTNHELYIVNALDSRAVDYLVKPFRTGELLSGIRLALRRKSGNRNGQETEVNRRHLKFEARTVRNNNEPVNRTAKEYSLLDLLAKIQRRDFDSPFPSAGRMRAGIFRPNTIPLRLHCPDPEKN